MKDFDKAALLFELLLGSDMRMVNRKIDEVSVSPDYRRVSGVMTSFYSTQLLEDVKKRFHQIDLYGVLSFNRALEVAKEVRDLDQRIAQLTTVNPYLSAGEGARKYKVRTVGQVGVEISTRGMQLNEFVTHQGVLRAHRTKQVKIKLFAWYKDAKASIIDMVETSKMFISKIRKSKVVFKSLNLESALLWLFSLGAIGYLVICPQMVGFRDGSLPATQATLLTYALYGVVAMLVIASGIRAHYKYYGFRFASALKGQATRQENLMTKLDKVSNEFEKYVIQRAKQPAKFSKLIDSFSVIQEKQTTNISNVVDYYHCEKEYYFSRYAWLVAIHHVIFALGIIISVAILASKLIFGLL